MSKMRSKRLRGKAGSARAPGPARPEVAMQNRAHARLSTERTWRRRSLDGMDEEDFTPLRGPRYVQALFNSAKSVRSMFKRLTAQGQEVADACESRESFEQAALWLGKSKAWADREWDASARTAGLAWACMDRPGLWGHFHDSRLVGWTRRGEMLTLEFEGPFDKRDGAGPEGAQRLVLAFERARARVFDGTVCRDLNLEGVWTRADDRLFLLKGPRRGSLGSLGGVDGHEYSGPGEPLALRLRFSRVSTLEIEVVAASVQALWGEAEIAAFELDLALRDQTPAPEPNAPKAL